MGPAPTSPFHEKKLQLIWHELMTNFSPGFICCWGVHHLDIAQWGLGADDTGPDTVEGSGVFPKGGTCDTILNWQARFEYRDRAPVTFVSNGKGIPMGVHFIGESASVHVRRGSIKADNEALLRDPQNKYGQMPVKLPVSADHQKDFVNAVRNGTRPICDTETAVRSDTLGQLALIAIQQGRKLQWDPKAEGFVNDGAAEAMLQPRQFRGNWELPTV